MEASHAWEVLRMVKNTPGITAAAVGGKGAARNKIKEARLRDLLAAGLLGTEEGTYCGRPCLKYYLSPRGELLAGILDLIERV